MIGYIKTGLIMTGFMGFLSMPSNDNTSFFTTIPSTSQTIPNNDYKYMGRYNSLGVPKYLTEKDDLGDNVLTDIRLSLPNHEPVGYYYPQYVGSNSLKTIELIEDADVWVTFVHEDAGYRNALAYYTYDVNNPPKSSVSRSDLTIIFPNASIYGGGGGLRTGDQVFLGHFSEGIGVGWALITDGWNDYDVKEYTTIFYSHPQWNSEASPTKQQHSVMLVDYQRQKLLIGFEDMNREQGSDHDFNDLLIYATVSPLSAVSNQGRSIYPMKHFEEHKSIVEGEKIPIRALEDVSIEK